LQGSTTADGRLDSIWDVSSRGKRPDGKPYTSGAQSGVVADGSYLRYAEDVALMRSMGIKHHRFSIAWPRILPTGHLPVNPQGIAHYSRFIDALVHAGITPAVTLYHWDLPEALNRGSTPGWLDHTTADRFQDYAKACFDAFGDRVKTWITFNEALTFVHLGYGSGSRECCPPACVFCVAFPVQSSLCAYFSRHVSHTALILLQMPPISAPTAGAAWLVRSFSPLSQSVYLAHEAILWGPGDSEREPYIAGHNVLRAHAQAVAAFRAGLYDGEIGITINANWAEPFDAKVRPPPSSPAPAGVEIMCDWLCGQVPADVAAAERSMIWQAGWWADPVYYGDYPQAMKDTLGNRLPRFTAAEKQMLKGSADFFGLNHYTSKYVRPMSAHSRAVGWDRDAAVQSLVFDQKHVAIGAVGASKWLRSVPWGIRKNLNWVALRYGSPKIYITENVIARCCVA
jgi:beta-glucosidase/6-phospho-beta-glucosidase/beta-galactosidase